MTPCYFLFYPKASLADAFFYRIGIATAVEHFRSLPVKSKKVYTSYKNINSKPFLGENGIDSAVKVYIV